VINKGFCFSKVIKNNSLLSGFVERFFEIDLARGIAIIAMIAFHFLFDLNYFAGQLIMLSQGMFLFLGRFSAASFVFLVGLSLTISYSRASRVKSGWLLFKKYLFRGIKIFFLGLLITLFTFLFFPSYTIFFGVLHFIGLSIILAFPFVRKRFFAFFLAFVFVLAGLWIGQFTFPFPWLLWLGLKPAGFLSFDYFPILPWFGLVLFGLFAGNKLYPGGRRAFKIGDFSKNPVVRFLSFLGRHSLVIYFLHQPILVAVILLLS
jgi:uncharacterized membrane protein